MVVAKKSKAQITQRYRPIRPETLSAAATAAPIKLAPAADGGETSDADFVKFAALIVSLASFIF